MEKEEKRLEKWEKPSVKELDINSTTLAGRDIHTRYRTALFTAKNIKVGWTPVTFSAK